MRHYGGGSVRIRKRAELEREGRLGTDTDYDETAEEDVIETDCQEDLEGGIENIPVC